MRTSMRGGLKEGDRRGIRTLLMMQGVLALLLGALFASSLGASLYLILIYLGAFWFLRGLGSLFYAYLDPGRWESRGLVAVLSLIAGAMVLQAPILGAFALTFSVVLFLGMQGLVTGGIEVFLGMRENSPAQALLGWLSLALGLLLLFYPWMGTAGLPPAMAVSSLLAGGLAVYFSSRGFEERLVERIEA